MGFLTFISKKKRNLRFRCNRQGFFLNSNDKALYKLKNKHRGQKAVVIGMGPSLKVSDLERFHKMKSFACNKIFLSFSDVKWRPDYYSICDVLVAENNQQTVLNTDFQEAVCLHSDVVEPFLNTQKDALFYRYGNTIPNSTEFVNYPHFGILSQGYSVLIDQIQWAYYMGFSTVYLVGVDFSFDLGEVTEELSLSGQVIVSKGEENHFHKDYRRKGESWTMPKMNEQKTAFEFCEKQFRANGRELINASRESKLDVLPKLDFDFVFPPNG